MGDAGDYFPHDHARSRACRWNEDSLAGVRNRFQNLRLGVPPWNERDPVLGSSPSPDPEAKAASGRRPSSEVSPSSRTTPLAPSHPLLLVLPRRQRSRPWHEPPDRVDSPCRQLAAAEQR
jgi:hypothetical protein